ncbi:MAG: L-seryl-tRNA(Sec) selenium transferase [Candidatus Binatia bacterium]
MAGKVNPLRAIPSVERLLRHPDADDLVRRYRRDRIVEATRLVLADLRRTLPAGGEVPSDAMLLADAASRLDAGARPRLTGIVNATGIVLHTNLGRALLSEHAITAMAAAARGATNIELDLVTGRRGDRDALLADDLCTLTGAEAALVVNNNAAAVLLAIAALAGGREVVVSRGELIEIGGSFRMPEVMGVSGARLREVGTTNRTHADDYRKAIGPETGLLVKVHASNYRIVGFTAEVELRDLVAIGRAHGVPVLDDLGSGALVDLAAHGLPAEPVVRDRIAAGADLVSFSGDKLLGGPQAGIVVGRRALVERLAGHPLRRALRLDKLRLAALGATLRLYREAPDLPAVLPTLRWLTRPIAEMETIGRAIAPTLAATLGAGHRVTVVESEAEVGSGAAPTATLPSRALAVEHPDVPSDEIAARFRRATPPVLGRIHHGRFLLDLRGVFSPTDLAVTFA